MKVHSLQFKGFSCFQHEWSTLPKIKPINLVIGKNNSGKSHLLNFIDTLTRSKAKDSCQSVHTTGVLDAHSLKRFFQPNTSGGTLGGDHWNHHGALFVGIESSWNSDAPDAPLSFQEGFDVACRFERNPRSIEARKQIISQIHNESSHQISGRSFRQLYADRDIQPEEATNKMDLHPNGTGATNIIRRFINSTNIKYPREVVLKDMLDALNEVFGEEGKFTEISIQHIDGDSSDKPDDLWEVYLAQEHKGLIALSQSGSSLKTVFLVLLNLLVIPHIDDNKSLSGYVFAFEELENNLHPSLLRRLCGYLCSFVPSDHETPFEDLPIFFLTTHSNVALDYFADQQFAQILHTTHDGKSAQVKPIVQSQDQLSILRDLGSKPSDLLQANGIIWVEGPSDRIYLNKWIELWSDGKYQEGRHYQCMFYGGGLLSNLQATSEEDATKELINLMKINPNSIVVSDSDKAKKGARLKERVRRIRDEFAKLEKDHNFHWILEAREVENYLTGDLMNEALTKPISNLPSPTQYQSFFPKKKETTKSYLELKAKRKSFDKTDLAIATTPHMTKTTLAPRFDLDTSMNQIIKLIETWNK